MTDNEIIKAFDILEKFAFFQGQRAGRELWNNKPRDIQDKDIGGFLRDLDFLRCFINRQKAEIERLEKYGEELQHKLECLLCHATGNKLSKSTYTLRTMESAVTDYIEDCCREAEEEARAEAIKEFEERQFDEARKKTLYDGKVDLGILKHISRNLVKEMTEGQK